MTLKSLLISAVAVGAGVSAYAFPTITTYPAPGGTYNSAQYFANLQLTSSEDFSIVSDCDMPPYFENWDTGDMITCSEFSDQDFNGMILHHVKFDESDFSDNGEWVLTIPSGCLKDADGNFNEEGLEFHYFLNDPNVGLGDFPQISLISSDPADGASIPYWGESLGKVTFVTDNDDAVNYIEWFLYDITYGDDIASRIYVRQGNENRIDVNRTFGDDSDQWVDGLFIAVGGANEKLLQGHTYRLYLTFCGIGYDPETNQYPNSEQIERSKELETYLDFHGMIPGTEYSPAEVLEVFPDPADYEFDNIDMRTFTIKYSGYVKPSMFVYALGQGASTAAAGDITPADEINEAGYAKVWDFTFFTSVLENVTGNISVTIEAADEDGLPVKGNGGFTTDDFEYKIDWVCNLGADKLISVNPLNGATVEELSSITVTNDGNKEMNLAYITIERPTLMSIGKAGIYIDLDEPVFSEDGKSATWYFDPITTSGLYSLVIPKQYFIIGSEMITTLNNLTSFSYTVEGDDEPVGDVVEDLVPETVSIENNANLTAPLDKIVLTFSDVTFASLETGAIGTLYYKATGETEFSVAEEVTGYDNDFFSPNIYTFEFASPVSENGEYRFEIPAYTFYDESYDMSGGTSGHVSPLLVYNFSYGENVGVSAIADHEGLMDVFDITGREVLRNADADQLKSLAAGIYIINGKKYILK